MKKEILFALFVIYSFASLGQNFYLHPNGVTCMCPNASVGETGVVNGVTYTKRTKLQITPQNASTTCTSGIPDMNGLFSNLQVSIEFNPDISTWDVSAVTDMSSMFWGVSSFNQDIGAWDVSNVTLMTGMFGGASSFNQDIGAWDVSNVIDMQGMFQEASSFNQEIGAWDVSNVTNMHAMFISASSFNQDISYWDFNPTVSFSAFLNGSGMDMANYELLLNSCDNQNLLFKNFGAEGLGYCDNFYRNNLIVNKGWTINGDTYLQASILPPPFLLIELTQGACEATNVNLGQPKGPWDCNASNVSLTNNAPSTFPVGNSTVTWSAINNFGNIVTAQQYVYVGLPNSNICYVTSDDLNVNMNRIFIANDDLVVQILRETSLNNFTPIGTIYPSEASFLDETSNNLSQTYKYIIKAIDTCGNFAGVDSPIHQTILLQSNVSANNSVNLNWNHYIGTDFNEYKIYRKINNENFELLEVISSSFNTFNDLTANVTQNSYEYYIAIDIENCIEIPGMILNENKSMTEIKSNRIKSDNLSIQTILDIYQIRIYPNPATSSIIMSSESHDIIGKKFNVTNILGQVAITGQITEQEMVVDLTNLSSGMYVINIIGESQSSYRIVKD